MHTPILQLFSLLASVLVVLAAGIVASAAAPSLSVCGNIPITGPVGPSLVSLSAATVAGCRRFGAISSDVTIRCEPMEEYILDDVSSPTIGLFNALELSTNSSKKCVGIIGDWNSAVSVQANLVASHLGMLQISPASTSPVLTSKFTYPTFARAVPSDLLQFAVLASLFKEFDWQRAVVLFTDDAFGEGGALAFVTEAANQNLSVMAQISIPFNVASSGVDITAKLEKCFNSGSNIIVTSMISSDAEYVLAEATKLGAFGNGQSKYVWIGTWISGLIGKGFDDGLRGALGTDLFVADTGAEYSQFKSDYEAVLGQTASNIQIDMPYQYDTVHVFMEALKSTAADLLLQGISVECLTNSYYKANTNACSVTDLKRVELWDQAHCNNTGATESCVKNSGVINTMKNLAPDNTPWGHLSNHPVNVFLHHLYKTSIDGASGNFSFDTNGDRIGQYYFINAHSVPKVGGGYTIDLKRVGVGAPYSVNKIQSLDKNAMVWAGGTAESPNTKPLRDGRPGPSRCQAMDQFGEHFFENPKENFDRWQDGVVVSALLLTLVIVEVIISSKWAFNRVMSSEIIDAKVEFVQIRRNGANFIHLISIGVLAFQISAITFAPDAEWQENIPIEKIVDTIGLDFSDTVWYYWTIWAGTVLWLIYTLIIVSGSYVTIEYYSIGRWFMMPVEFYIPTIPHIGFIPIVSALLGSVSCKYGYDLILERIQPSAFLVNNCDIQCWETEHWSMVSLGYIVVIVFIPFAMLSAHFWQDIAEDLDILYDPRYFIVESLVKLLMVALRIFIADFEMVFLPLIFIINIAMVVVIHKWQPCRLKWINNWLKAIYILGSFSCFVSFLASALGDENGLWPFVLLLVGYTSICLVAFFLDRRWYPNKFSEAESGHRLSVFKKLFHGHTLADAAKSAVAAIQNLSNLTINSVRGHDKEHDKHEDEIWREITLLVEVIIKDPAFHCSRDEDDVLHNCLMRENSCLRFIYEVTIGRTKDRDDISEDKKVEQVELFEKYVKSLIDADLRIKASRWRSALHIPGSHEDSLFHTDFHMDDKHTSMIDQVVDNLYGGEKTKKRAHTGSSKAKNNQIHPEVMSDEVQRNDAPHGEIVITDEDIDDLLEEIEIDNSNGEKRKD
eukprot:Nk52_evm2s1607 gene=Nk52_evmTU2s1607